MNTDTQSGNPLSKVSSMLPKFKFAAACCFQSMRQAVRCLYVYKLKGSQAYLFLLSTSWQCSNYEEEKSTNKVNTKHERLPPKKQPSKDRFKLKYTVTNL